MNFADNLSEIQTLQDTCIQDVSRRGATSEEQLLNDCLRDHLKKDPTTSDYKKCTMIYIQGKPNEFQFLYDGILLGYGKREVELYQRPEKFSHIHSVRYIFSFLPAKDN